MAEYIKREDAMKALDEYRLSQTMSKFGDMELLMEYRDGVVGAMNAIAFVPAADVAEVVRCKDCANSKNFDDGTRKCLFWHETGIGVCDNDFCSYGERK